MIRKLNIGICDDHVMTRQGLAMVLNHQPEFEVTLQASDGSILLKILDRADPFPDIILLDINMPDLDGYRTMACLNEAYPTLKVIGLSMYESEYSIIRMFRLGAKGYLDKGQDTQELKMALLKVSEGEWYHRDVGAVNFLAKIRDEKAWNITERERVFLEHCCSEDSYKVIADKMGFSDRTIHGYRDTLFEKLEVNTRMGLVMFALSAGIVLHANK